MFSPRSIRNRFLIQLIFSSALLILLFSSALYFFIKTSIYEEKQQELLQYAKNISNNKAIMQNDGMYPENILSLSIEVIYLKNAETGIEVYEKTDNMQTFLTLIYPFNINDASYLKVSKEITHTFLLLDKILHYIFIINIGGFVRNRNLKDACFPYKNSQFKACKHE